VIEVVLGEIENQIFGRHDLSLGKTVRF